MVRGGRYPPVVGSGAEPRKLKNFFDIFTMNFEPVDY